MGQRTYDVEDKPLKRNFQNSVKVTDAAMHGNRLTAVLCLQATVLLALEHVPEQEINREHANTAFLA